jgi:peptide deformylase
MKYELVDCNDPILKQPMPLFDFDNPPVDPLDLVSNLAETMLEEGGIGISANQCGLQYRVFVMNADELIPCFNPRIVDTSTEQVYLEEGCLSFPGLYVKVKRPRRIKVRYTEPNGNVVTRTFDGMTARVFQHELDHLDGIAHINRASRIHLNQARKRLKLAKRRNK